jgi:phytoene dehydrogenase-like protein
VRGGKNNGQFTRGKKAMSQTFDVISVGSGHHGLVAAAYMAKAGKSVLVLERHDCAGGGCVTKELIPGHYYDEHATVHQVILSNPLLKNDELALKSRFAERSRSARM